MPLSVLLSLLPRPCRLGTLSRTRVVTSGLLLHLDLTYHPGRCDCAARSDHFDPRPQEPLRPSPNPCALDLPNLDVRFRDRSDRLPYVVQAIHIASLNE